MTQFYLDDSLFGWDEEGIGLKIAILGSGVIGTLYGWAFADLTQNAPDAKYLLMASNWTGMAEIDSYLNKDQYILGYAGGGGTLRNVDGQSELWGNIGADVTLGTVYPEPN